MIARTQLSFACSLLAVAFLTACSPGPEKTVERFYHAVEAGDIKAAAGVISKTLVGMIGQPKMEAGLQQQSLQIKAKGGIAKLEVKRTTEVKDLVDVHTTIEYGDHSKEEEDLRLVREDGDWKIAPKK